MKLTIDRAALIKPLRHVRGVVERRNSIPILGNVVLRVEEGTLTLTATDMDMDIVETVPATVLEQGVVTVPAVLLFEIVSKLPEGSEIEIAADSEERVTITAGRSNFALPTLAVADFPAISDDKMTTEFTLAATDLKTLIERTSFAVSSEETRYYLNGIYIHIAEEKLLRTVATDGHRLARSQIEMPKGAESLQPAIIPRKAVGEISKLIDEYEGDVSIGFTETKARFGFGSVQLTTKLIDGTFPDYQRVIPTDNSNIMTVSATAFKEAVDRVSIISAERTRAVRLRISKGSLTLLTSSPDAASGEETLEVTYDGDDLEVGYNARYLLDIGEQIDGDSIEFAMTDSALPSVIRAPDDEANLFVLMPMRV